ncbi:hypothetical protein [Streptomyces sp. NPDC048496]
MPQRGYTGNRSDALDDEDDPEDEFALGLERIPDGVADNRSRP